MQLLCDSRLTDEFKGWSGETIFDLDDGSQWKQSVPGVVQAYRYKPKVKIWQKGEEFYLQVEGMDVMVLVERVR